MKFKTLKKKKKARLSYTYYSILHMETVHYNPNLTLKSIEWLAHMSIYKQLCHDTKQKLVHL